MKSDTSEIAWPRPGDYSTCTDEEVMARFQAGESLAFEEIVVRFKDRIYNFLFRFFSREEMAEDILHDTFLRVYKKKHLYRPIARFSTWIFTIAKNLALTEIKRQKTQQTFPISTMGFTEREYQIAGDFHRPEDIIESEVTERVIQQALGSLPSHYRTVVILRDIEGLSYQEISQILEVPVGTVKSRVNRGRRQIQQFCQVLGRVAVE